MKRFANKVVIITGSSNGIGRAAAVLFAEEGATVTIHGRSAQALQETFDQVAAVSSSDRILKVQGDITNDEVQKKLIVETAKKFGAIDILINNAGGLCPDNSKELGFEQSSETFDYTMNLNVKSILNLSKLALSHLEKTKGAIVNISSIAGQPLAARAYPFYSVAKAALDQLTRQMAITFIEKGVRVNSVNPGPISTTFIQKQGITAEMQQGLEDSISTPRLIPAGRMGKPMEVAKVIAFLADKDSSDFIIGQTFIIDGGVALLNPLMQSFDTDLK